MSSATDIGGLLERARFQADPLADATIARILGEWAPLPEGTLAQSLQVHAQQWQRLAAVNRVLAQWPDNAGLPGWRAPDADAAVAAPLEAYVQAACALPPWADPAQIQRAEDLFLRDGPLSCLLLFCASLPECYVIPDLAAVLHAAGQLEQHTEHRIRATAAMIFPVMLPGGLTGPAGAGLAQVLKVRLIHATIRHLILRGDPQAVLQAHGGAPVAGAGVPAGGEVPPLALPGGARSMHQAMFALGWRTRDMGLPCNQEELAYTLLTFHYVFLRGMRTLGLGLSADDERAWLHAWNVAGHVLGIGRELMPESMAQAGTLFDAMQARGRAHIVAPDPRPALAHALVQTMSQAIPLRVARPFPTLMTRKLCGPVVSQELALHTQVAWPSRTLFTLLMALTGGIDALARRVWPDFSITGALTRAIGTQVVARLLLDQTRPLALPQHLLNRIAGHVATWPHDARAPRWLDALSRRLSRAGVTDVTPNPTFKP